MLKASVIIPTCNRSQRVKKTIQYILQGDFPKDKYEIIVCDDGSTDDTENEIQDLQKKNNNIVYFKIPHCGNVSHVRNIGIDNSKGEILAFTDSDCLPKYNWLKEGLSFFNSAEIAGVEGWICTDKIIGLRWIAPVKGKRSRDLDGKGWYGYYLCNMFYRSDIVKKAGGLDERFDVTNEDIDLAWRVLEYGRIIPTKKASVFHHAILYSEDKLREFYHERRIYDALLFSKHPESYKIMYQITLPYNAITVGILPHLFLLIKGMFKFKVILPLHKLILPLFTYLKRYLCKLLKRKINKFR